MSPGWTRAAVLAVTATAGCMAGTNSVRPQPLMPGQLRLGVVQGVVRNYADDFAFAQPTGEAKEKTSPAWLTEITAHYGVIRDLDVGARLRPFSNGGKLEAFYQAVRERTLGVGIALGVGVDGFYSPRERIACVAEGCFSRRYGGLMVDVPVVFSRHLWRRGTVFVAGRYAHLLMWGEERYKSRTKAFPAQVNDKTFNQWVAGWVVGLEVEWLWLRVVPQLSGATTAMPDGSIKHVIYPALDIAGVF